MKDITELPEILPTITAAQDKPRDHCTTPLTLLLFFSGQVVSTPAALAAMQTANVEPISLLRRHLSGDWGDLDEQDKQTNDAALKNGSRIFSAYNISQGQRIWIITEADRSSTCFLLPSEY